MVTVAVAVLKKIPLHIMSISRKVCCCGATADEIRYYLIRRVNDSSGGSLASRRKQSVEENHYCL